MYAPAGVKTDAKTVPVPESMRAWVLGDPEQLILTDKPVPVPGRVRGAGRDRCGRDLRDGPRRHQVRPAGADQGRPAIQQELDAGPRVHGHGGSLGPGVDEFAVGDRITVEIHAGCGQCKRCRMGMYTSCLNYGLNYGDGRQGPSGQRLHHRRRICRIRDQQYQHPVRFPTR